MGKKKSKGRATKTIARKKKPAKATARKTRTTKAVKKPRKATTTTSPQATAPVTPVTAAMDLLRSWSPSRYSKR